MACGPARDEGNAEGSGGGSSAGESFDYSHCEGVRADPECEGIACAPEGPARDMTALLLDVIDEQGKSDVITIRRVSHYPDTNQLIVDLHLQVEWYRAWEFINTKIPETTAELREVFAGAVASWEIPEHVVASDVIAAAMASCDPSLVYDPCADNWHLGVAHTQVDGEAPGCTPWSTWAEVDVTTGELTNCVIHEEYGCE